MMMIIGHGERKVLMYVDVMLAGAAGNVSQSSQLSLLTM